MPIMKGFLMIAMLLGSVIAWGQTDTCDADCQKRKFRAFTDSLAIDFRVPKGFNVEHVKDNPDLHYRFALLKADSSIEVRYSVFPLKEVIRDYEKQLKKNPKLKEQLIHPNEMYNGLVKTTLQKLAVKRDWEILAFDSVSVKNEFGADAGGTSFFVFNSAFGKGYQFGQFVYLHRENVADVIITFLCNDKEKMPELMRAPFQSLVFRESIR